MTTLETIRAIIADATGADARDITEASTIADFRADSLDFAEAMFVIEDEFCVTLPDSAVMGAVTVGDLVRAVDLAGGAQ